jgi:membrane protein YdbS with pleckstrin-like domain
MSDSPIESAKAIWVVVILVGAVGGILFSVYVMGWPFNWICSRFAALLGIVTAVVVAFSVEFVRAIWKG